MAALAQIIPINGTLVEIQDHLECLFDSLDMTPENSPERAECESDIARYLDAEIRKVDSISGYLAHCEAQQAFAAAEVKRLQDRKRSFERKQERIEVYIQRVIETSGKAKLEGRTSTLLLKSCPPSVEVVDESDVPQEFMRVVINQSVDKLAAVRALKSGETIPGLRLVTDRRTVVRK